MSNTKKCPHCGNTFEGRSNKIYCSNKCKMAAFQQDKAQDAPPKTEFSEPLLTGNPLPHFRPKDKPQTENKEQILKLQIELRKLELAHQKEIALLQAQDRERERNFELKKMQLTFEQEKKELQNEIAGLQKENRFVLQQNNENEHEKTIKEQETEEYEEETTENDWESEDSETYEDDAIVLPEQLEKRYKAFIKRYLALHNTQLSKERAQKALQVAQDIQSEIERFSDENEVEADEWWEYEILQAITKNLQEVIECLNGRLFFQTKVFDFQLQQDWYRQLKESIED